LQTIVNGWHDKGYRVGFLTLTVRHRRYTPLTEVWQLVMDAWHGLTSGEWTRLQREHGVALPGRGGRVLPRIPTVRTVEVTHGKNGWHVHLHVLVFFSPAEDAHRVWGEVSGMMVQRWLYYVQKVGGKASPRGICAELVSNTEDSAGRIGEYLAKSVFVGHGDHSAIHWEAAGGLSKTSERTGGLTPWELLDRASAGDSVAAKLWSEWELGSRGRRQMWIVGSLLDLFGLRDETDADAFAAGNEQAENGRPDNLTL